MTKKLVIIESPYAGDTDANEAYLNECLRDSLMRGEAPFASHAIYTRHGVLDDSIPEERNLGIKAGLAWCDVAKDVTFYLDRGVSREMHEALDRWIKAKKFIWWRVLSPENEWMLRGFGDLVNKLTENTQ